MNTTWASASGYASCISGKQSGQCPLLAISRRFKVFAQASALPPKADIQTFITQGQFDLAKEWYQGKSCQSAHATWLRVTDSAGWYDFPPQRSSVRKDEIEGDAIVHDRVILIGDRGLAGYAELKVIVYPIAKASADRHRGATVLTAKVHNV